MMRVVSLASLLLIGRGHALMKAHVRLATNVFQLAERGLHELQDPGECMKDALLCGRQPQRLTTETKIQDSE